MQIVNIFGSGRKRREYMCVNLILDVFRDRKMFRKRWRKDPVKMEILSLEFSYSAAGACYFIKILEILGVLRFSIFRRKMVFIACID